MDLFNQKGCLGILYHKNLSKTCGALDVKGAEGGRGAPHTIKNRYNKSNLPEPE